MDDKYSYSYEPENNSENPASVQESQTTSPEKPKKHGVVKAIKSVLFVLCMAAVSVGSIAGYKYIDEHGNPFKEKSNITAFEESRKLPPKDDKKP